MTLIQSLFRASVTRIEHEALLIGKPRFTDDIILTNTLTPAVLWDLIHNSKGSTGTHWQSDELEKQSFKQEEVNG